MKAEGWKQAVNGTATIAKAMKGNVSLSVLLYGGPKNFASLQSCLGTGNSSQIDPVADCGMMWQSRFSDNKSPEQVVDDIEKMTWPQGTTLTSMALMEASAELSLGRTNASGVVIVVTDGNPISK